MAEPSAFKILFVNEKTFDGFRNLILVYNNKYLYYAIIFNYYAFDAV